MFVQRPLRDGTGANPEGQLRHFTLHTGPYVLLRAGGWVPWCDVPTQDPNVCGQCRSPGWVPGPGPPKQRRAKHLPVTGRIERTLNVQPEETLVVGVVL